MITVNKLNFGFTYSFLLILFSDKKNNNLPLQQRMSMIPPIAPRRSLLAPVPTCLITALKASGFDKFSVTLL